MNNPGVISVNLERIKLLLFGAYAFSIPFELILEMWFGIETIFKPFRIISLAIVAVFLLQVIRNGFSFKIKYPYDLWLLLAFGYGVIISAFRIISGVFNLGLFYNDLLQTGLHLTVFFVFKSADFNRNDILLVFKFFIAGVFINALVIFNDFFLGGFHGRQTGFTDNPNYVSLALVAVMTYLLLNIEKFKGGLVKILAIISIPFLLYIFIITGSRAGLALFIASLLMIFIFAGIRKKIFLVFIAGLITLMLLPQQLDKIRLGGPLILFVRVADNIGSDENDVRFAVWRGVFRALEENGYMGMGIGQFKAKFPRYYQEEPQKLIHEIVNRNYFLSTHNDYLAMLTDYGIPSLIFYLLFLLASVKAVFKNVWMTKESVNQIALAKYSFIILVCIVIFGMAAENFQHQLYWFLLMISTKIV